MTTNSHEWAVNVFINDYSWTFMAIHVIIFFMVTAFYHGGTPIQDGNFAACKTTENCKLTTEN